MLTDSLKILNALLHEDQGRETIISVRIIDLLVICFYYHRSDARYHAVCSQLRGVYCTFRNYLLFYVKIIYCNATNAVILSACLPLGAKDLEGTEYSFFFFSKLYLKTSSELLAWYRSQTKKGVPGGLQPPKPKLKKETFL